MSARVVSLLVAVVGSFAGHLVLFFGVGWQTALLQRLDPRQPIAAVVVLVGILLIVVAVGTTGWSSAGLIVVAVVHLLIGGTALVVQSLLRLGEFFVTAQGGYLAMQRTSREFGTGVLDLVPAGVFFAEGLLFLVIALAVRGRHRVLIATPAAARTVSVVVVLLTLVPGALLLATGAVRLQSQISVAADVTAPLLIATGSVVLAVTVLTVRWSSLGALIGGGALTVAGAALLLAVRPAFGVVDSIARPLDRYTRAGLQHSAFDGVLALLGAIVLAAGIAAVIAGRRGARRHSWVALGTDRPDGTDAAGDAISPYGIRSS